MREFDPFASIHVVTIFENFLLFGEKSREMRAFSGRG
jgi:hypothetical protein